MSDYEDAYRTFDLSVPERFNPVLDILEPWSSEHPDDRALLSLDADGRRVSARSAAELARDSRVAARALLSLGVEKGDRLFIMLPRIPAWYSVVLGAIRIGAVPMPGPTQLTGKDIAFRVERAQAPFIVTDSGGARKVADIADRLTSVRQLLCVDGDAPPGWTDLSELLAETSDGETPPDPTGSNDPMLVYFTSGTVSHPKMVTHVQSYALGHVRTARYWHDLRHGDVHWTVSDAGWVKAVWGGFFGQWVERATVVQAALGRPDASRILQIIADHEITSFCAPPTLYRTLVQADLRSYDLSRLRHCTSAGEPLNPAVIRAWSSGTGGVVIYDGYGQTETTALVANYRCLPVRPGSMGKPMPGYEISVVDDDGRSLPPDELGSIAVRAQPAPVGLFAGYTGDDEATAQVFRHGWYYTGDKARVDADGYFWFDGRADDVITSSAYRIGPFEVESALVEHPAVVESAVVGRDDPERTQIVCAFVILADSHDPSDALARELQAHVRRVTAPYKYPREIHFVDELPKTVSGKIRRGELRRQLQSGQT